ncbi:hypothetical protein JZ751_014126 [Albula glossodonta]|uniref:Nicotinamide/nicotinic acid mononucleotide adenylyltransferase 3 n=1 Tax=Albula glossodonta TaxID=121402 RepID=A0A8T2NQL1_9TELE|nr:hypothetical protein JZ751_014126 [Albula glossodonta]
MARLALRSSDWVTVDDWESKQPDWTATVLTMSPELSADVRPGAVHPLTHPPPPPGAPLTAGVDAGSCSIHDTRVLMKARRGGDSPLCATPCLDQKGKVRGTVSVTMCPGHHYGRILKQHPSTCPDGASPPDSHHPPAGAPQLKLLCGADFLRTFHVPGLWLAEHVEEVAGRFGLVCVSRGNLQPDRAVHESDTLSRHSHNIFQVREWVHNEISATEVRRALRRGLSVKYLLPDLVIDYIREHNLYTWESEQKNKDTVLRPLRQQGAPSETLAD